MICCVQHSHTHIYIHSSNRRNDDADDGADVTSAAAAAVVLAFTARIIAPRMRCVLIKPTTKLHTIRA